MYIDKKQRAPAVCKETHTQHLFTETAQSELLARTSKYSVHPLVCSDLFVCWLSSLLGALHTLQQVLIGERNCQSTFMYMYV